ncbi:uncharacterized protein MONOS_9396 [Monocercomonoides exilis]|uniref:uncharacterized protein n=1 Tax=Monocercomonoides exilis TaxID=2049356 RepID=UPI00355A2F28|nr:hypothetical protein MONOS_9396 [Monocercomonoides exilis]|eukprot:MONOS_9396.1-p1 / transcript=MONOS_9396.1 / gene=MONOS_9396 / organism=Monocercomonoides_exilis_PA203 / gene_product=unspecified product / transcript_product=unspecified product / location=Mono_scaffold00387:7190-8002(-) / protein_length=252 / sequence_SO=supercontig / SO=protein_coding / is_pseudo=false
MDPDVPTQYLQQQNQLVQYGTLPNAAPAVFQAPSSSGISLQPLLIQPLDDLITTYQLPNTFLGAKWSPSIQHTLSDGVPAWGQGLFHSYIAYCLCALGAVLVCGMHRCYYGDRTTGLVYFLTLGLCTFGQLLDVFLIPGMTSQRNAEIRSIARIVAARKQQAMLRMQTTVVPGQPSTHLTALPQPSIQALPPTQPTGYQVPEYQPQEYQPQEYQPQEYQPLAAFRRPSNANLNNPQDPYPIEPYPSDLTNKE